MLQVLFFIFSMDLLKKMSTLLFGDI